uniref:Transmembrane anterior posterior transformation protein 1 n=1 Tax=Tetracapsuloides bryosalmonae TaxID=271932 RepID=A0A859IQU1_9CNID|nr:transmembrane anterior posterior transformation protein 1 [Tetracapsuloides bryosalmonae]
MDGCNPPCASPLVKFNTLKDIIFLYLDSEILSPLIKNDQFNMQSNRRIKKFLRTPFELEKFIFVTGLFCMDDFISCFTILPLRLLLCIPISMISYLKYKKLIYSFGRDIFKIINIFMVLIFLSKFEVSYIYHVVKAQNIIKIYVFFNILDVIDKLFSSIGHDMNNSFFTQSHSLRSKYFFLFRKFHYFCLALIYNYLHSIVILLQTICLCVAVNSRSRALLTLVISNQFLEVKGSIFKKFDSRTLFLLMCSDSRERFTFLIIMNMVILSCLIDENSTNLSTIIGDLILAFISELLVDWLKHSFISWFNSVDSEIYSKYLSSLSSSFLFSSNVKCHQESVAQKLSFFDVPLVITLIHVILHKIDDLAIKFGKLNYLLWIIILFQVKIIIGLLCKIFAVIYYESFPMKIENENSLNLSDFREKII